MFLKTKPRQTLTQTYAYNDYDMLNHIWVTALLVNDNTHSKHLKILDTLGTAGNKYKTYGLHSVVIKWLVARFVGAFIGVEDHF